VTTSENDPTARLDVEPRTLPGFERHDLRALLEATQLDVDLIASRNQVHDLIRAGLGRRLVRLDVGRGVGHGDRRAGHDAAAGVADDAAQGGAIDLRRKAGHVQKEHGDQSEHAVQRPFHEHSSKIDGHF
jgi:hypothetical protein